MAGFFDSGGSSSNQYSGLRADGWQYRDTFDKVHRQAGDDAMFLSDRTRNLVNSANPFDNLINGFTSGQLEGVNRLGANLFNNVSSNYASRGLMNPNNISGVVGSAVREAAPGLMSLVGENLKNQEAIRQGRLGVMQGNVNLFQGLLGSEGHSKTGGTNLLAGSVAKWADPNSYANLISSLGGGGGGGQSGAQAIKGLMF
jgi:hypothetical protein